MPNQSPGTIVNVSVTAKQQAQSASLPNVTGITVHAAPGNTVNLLVYLGNTSPYLTLAPDDAVSLTFGQLPDVNLLYLAASDGSTSTAAEILV